MTTSAYGRQDAGGTGLLAAGSIGRRYAPFLVIVLVQALLVAVVPSTGPSNGNFLAGGGGGQAGIVPGSAGAGFESSTDGGGGTVSFETGGGPTDGSAGGAGAASRAGAGGGSAPGGGSGDATFGGISGLGRNGVARGLVHDDPGVWPWSHSWLIDGDRSSCAPGGQLQDDVLTTSPPCVPRFTGDNSGATYQGVTAEEITSVWYFPRQNEAANAVLAAGDLYATREQWTKALETYTAFFNKHYEFYGRKLKSLYFEGDCDGTDIACIRAEVRAMNTKLKPFVVTQFLLPEMHDELARLGVMTVGCWYCSDRYRNAHAPFMWDLFTSSTQAAVNVADYYCKRMVGKNASLAGDPTLRPLKRKLAVVSPGDDIYREAAERMSQFVTGEMCGSAADKPVVVTYEIDRAQEQAQGMAVALKQSGATTVVCLCDLFIPIFLTRAMDDQQYFPEHLLALQEGADHEYLGRLYSPTQWQNAFGPGFRPKEIAFEEQDNTKAWRDVHGKQPTNDEQPYVTTVIMMYTKVLAYMLQWAGPNLNPRTFERGAFDAPQMGGWAIEQEWPGWKCCDPVTQLWKFAPGDYTAVNDSKQIYYDPSAISDIDGRPGAYICIDDCRRYPIGGWTKGEPREP